MNRESLHFYGVVLLFAVLVLGALVASCRGGDCDLALDAVCRVRAGDGVGTGWAFERSNGYVYAMTCAHVVGNANAVQTDWFTSGSQSANHPTQVVQRDTNADAAVLAIGEKTFNGRLPVLLTLADKCPSSGYLSSAGCPKATWPTAHKGHVIRLSQMGLEYTPPPLQGRSGGPVLIGGRVVGMVRANNGVNGNGATIGYATPIEQIRAALEKRTSYPILHAETLAQYTEGYPPEVTCPGGLCPTPQYPPSYRQPAPVRPQQPYSTAPPPTWRQPIESLPDAPPDLVPAVPIPVAPPAMSRAEIIAEIRVVIAEMQATLRGEPGKAGPPGSNGADGKDGKPGERGPAGRDADTTAINAELNALRLEIHSLRNLPPLRVRVLDEQGNTIQESEARLGDTLVIRPLVVRRPAEAK